MNDNAHTPKVKRDYGISPMWLLPLLTIVLAGWLVVQSISESGQRIQIYFSDAAGLVAGRTTIRYQGLEVGMVRDINLSKDLSNIYVSADIYPEAAKLLGEDTRFWMVKPTASLSGISGLDALVSGNYIAILPGQSIHDENSKRSQTTKYHALKNSPADNQTEDGLSIVLKSKDLGSLSIGSKIFYKKIPIGEVYNYTLSDSADSVLIKASIDDQYRHIINGKSRFWNVSGINANIGFEGIDVRLESLSGLLSGAIAVDSPEGGEAITAQKTFRLYPDLKTAGRGIAINITLPDDHGIGAHGAPIKFRGIEIGQITNISLGENREHIVASAAIQPIFSDMLTSESQFILEEAKLSLTEAENLKNFVTGNYLTIIPSEGERSRQFKVIRKHQFNQETQQATLVKLKSDNSFGQSSGTPVLYRGIEVGNITSVALDNDEVIMDALIENEYTHLIKSKSRFFVTGSAQAELTESGLSISVPPAKQLLSGSISFVSEGNQQIKNEYALFANQSLAELAKSNQSGTVNITLYSSQMPPVSVDSPILYRNLAVGSVRDFSLVDGGVVIRAKINKQYSHLINDRTVFWNRSGIEVNASLSGLKVVASPLKTLIQGGLAFDSITGVENKTGKHWKIYDNYDDARSYGKDITLVTTGEQIVKPGMDIRYQGVKVGEVTLTVPNFKKKRVEITARILPEYVSQVALDKSHFWIVEPKLSISGIKNMASIIGNHIEVNPMGTKAHHQFKLRSEPEEMAGTSYTLQSTTRGSINVGTPLLYRDITVGEVTAVNLGELADRVLTTIKIYPQYRYLIRENSVFWNVSGLDVSIGLTGADIKTGTMDSILKGGVTFATPEQSELMPIAASNSTFVLHTQAETSWKNWRTVIPKP